MAFLARILASIGQWLLTVLVGKLVSAFRDYQQKQKEHKEIVDAVKKYKSTTTPEDEEREFENLLRTIGR